MLRKSVSYGILSLFAIGTYFSVMNSFFLYKQTNIDDVIFMIIYTGNNSVFREKLTKRFLQYNINKSRNFKVTHQAPCSVLACFALSLTRVFVFRTYGRTDTMCENKDYLFGRRGLVDQYMSLRFLEIQRFFLILYTLRPLLNYVA